MAVQVFYKDIEVGKKGQFVVSPLNQGDGTTLGNAMRRLLLSDMEGVAITAVWIDGVNHEFSAIKGVKEDVVDIVLNLKGVVLKQIAEIQEEEYVIVRASGKGVITAGDIPVTSALEIVNKDHVIATLDADANVNMKLYIGKGTGYVMNKENKKKYNEIGVIAIDSMYSPVSFTSYIVEDTREAGEINKEKLTLEVATKGNSSPEEVVKIAATKLKSLANLFLSETEEVAQPVLNEKTQIKKTDPIEVLQLDVRAVNSFKQAGYLMVGDICSLTEQQLKGTRKIGTKTAEGVIERLYELGLKLKDSPNA